MPQIKLNIGPMSLEGDDTGKGDSVIAHLYNGYRANSTDGSQTIFSIPGYVDFCDLGTSPATVDGDYFSILHDVRLAVSAGRVWIIAMSGSKTELAGAILLAGLPVSFTEDENYIYFCAASEINRFDPTTNAIDQLGGQAPINCTHLSYLKGYLIAKGDDAAGGGIPGDVWYSSSATAVPYSTWAVFNNMARPDAVAAVFTSFKEIYAIGRETSEVSYATTDPNAPFAANDGATQPFGTQAPYSVAFDGQSIYYLTCIGGAMRIARLVGGREAQILSFAVDVNIDKEIDLTNARGWIHSFRGQTFYVLSMPSANVLIDDQVHKGTTLAFNIKSQEWYIWYEWDATNVQCKNFPADTFLFVEPFKRRFIGHNGKIYEIKEDADRLGDKPIRMRIRTAYRTWGKGARKLSAYYRYSLKRGITGTTTNPVMVHRWRNNNNAEWTSGRLVYLGTEGNRNIFRQSNQCGQYISRQDEFIFPDNVPIVFNSVEEEIKALE